MAYPQVQIRSVLKRLRKVLPQATSVRIDPLFESRSYPENDRARIFTESTNTPLLDFTTVGSAESTREAVLSHIQEKLSCGMAQAEEVLEIGHRLCATTNMGAWCLRPTEVPQLVASSARLGDTPMLSTDYLSRIISELGRLLPTVQSLEIQYHKNVAPKRLRTWLALVATDGSELASIDSSGFALHARSELIRPAIEKLETNLERNRRWASDLGCTQKDIPQLFHAFTFFTSFLSLTRVDLR